MAKRAIEFTQEGVICTFKAQTAYPVQELDWKKLKKMVEDTVPRTNLFQVAASFSAGVAASALFTLFSYIPALKGLPIWVLVATWCALIIGAIAAIFLLALDKQQDKFTIVQAENLLDEMNAIEAKWAEPDVPSLKFADCTILGSLMQIASGTDEPNHNQAAP